MITRRSRLLRIFSIVEVQDEVDSGAVRADSFDESQYIVRTRLQSINHLGHHLVNTWTELPTPSFNPSPGPFLVQYSF
jgi:hypothetical protein